MYSGPVEYAYNVHCEQKYNTHVQWNMFIVNKDYVPCEWRINIIVRLGT